MRSSMVSRLAWVALALGAGHTTACGPMGAEPTETAGASDEATLGRLAWMAGSWRGEHRGRRFEEHWLEPQGGVMLGLHRDVFASGKVFYEYLRIEATDEGVHYVASPGGGPATAFRLSEVGDERVTFSNPEHDFPQRILYWREGSELHAAIEGETESGTETREWVFHPTAIGRE